jgi:hypothetical protein
MKKECAICNENIFEEFGKLKGTMLKVLDLNKKAEFIFVCPDCQKQDKWIEKAKIKGA